MDRQAGDKMKKLPELADVATDQQTGGLAASLAIDRATASRLGIAPDTIDNTLYDAFGQRQISTMYTQLNQYHVILEADPESSRARPGCRICISSRAHRRGDQDRVRRLVCFFRVFVGRVQLDHDGCALYAIFRGADDAGECAHVGGGDDQHFVCFFGEYDGQFNAPSGSVPLSVFTHVE